MSTNVSAILYYGIQISDQQRWGESPYDDLTLNKYWKDEHGPVQPEDDSDYKTPAWDAWRNALRVYEGSCEHVKMDWSGSENYRSMYVHCPCLEKEVEWAEQMVIPIGQLPAVVIEADNWMAKFCKKFDIPYQQPSWHLAARYF